MEIVLLPPPVIDGGVLSQADVATPSRRSVQADRVAAAVRCLTADPVSAEG